MIGQGEIIVIDDFVSLEYQEKIKQNFWELIIIFLGFILRMLQTLVNSPVNTDQQWHINM